MLLDLSLQSLWQHKVRSFLTVLGIVMAIAAIVSLGSISEGLSNLIGEQLKFASGYITVQEAGSTHMSGPPGVGVKIDLSILDEIRQIEGVQSASPQIFAISNANNVFVVGIPLEDFEYFDLQNIGFREGGLPTEGAKEVVLGYKAAESEGLKAGDSIDLGKDEYVVSGVFEELNNFIDFGAITSFGAASDTFDYEGYASDFIVEPADVGEVERIAAEIEERFDELDAVTPVESAETAGKAIDSISIFTLGIGVVASIVASIGIINTMVMAVLERKREFGIMKALGAEKNVILSLVVGEATILGVVGGVLGVAIGYAGVAAVNMAYPFPIASASARLIAISFAYSIVLAVLAALYPAYRAVKVDAVEAMREE
jgi:putative ABC transport system permease protein